MQNSFVRMPAIRLFSSALMASCTLIVPASALGQNAYITVTPAKPGPTGVAVINTASAKVTGKLTVEGAANAVAVTPDGTKVLVSDSITNQIFVFDAASHIVDARIPAQNVFQIAVAPDGSRAYFASQSDGVGVIDLATFEVVKNIHFLDSSYLGVTPDGTKVYVSDGDNTVAVIDTISNTIAKRIHIPPTGEGVSFPINIAFLPSGAKAYVANYQNNNVSVIDTATNKIVATIPTGREPDSIAVAPDGSKIYVAQSFASQVSVIDTATNKVTTTAAITHPYGISLTADGTRAYVTSDNGMIVLDTGTLKTIKQIATGGQPDIVPAAIGAASSSLSATAFPAAGSIQTGKTAETRVVVTNSGSSDLTNCAIKAFRPSGANVDLAYRPIDAKGDPTGSIDHPVTIAKQTEQAFRVVLSGTTARVGGPIPLIVDCDGVTRAPTATDFNTFDLAVSASETANILAVSPAPDALVSVPINGSRSFGVTAVNNGAPNTLTVSADTGTAPLPVSLTVCPAKLGTTMCLSSPRASASVSFPAKARQSFVITAHAADHIH